MNKKKKKKSFRQRLQEEYTNTWRFRYSIKIEWYRTVLSKIRPHKQKIFFLFFLQKKNNNKKNHSIVAKKIVKKLLSQRIASRNYHKSTMSSFEAVKLCFQVKTKWIFQIAWIGKAERTKRKKNKQKFIPNVNHLLLFSIKLVIKCLWKVILFFALFISHSSWYAHLKLLASYKFNKSEIHLHSASNWAAFSLQLRFLFHSVKSIEVQS